MEKNTPEQVCPNISKLLSSFLIVEDPRRKQALRHPLMGILLMAFCTVAMGADSWDDIADLSEIHFNWFAKQVECGKCAPSADTFRRVTCAIDPKALNKVLETWLIQKGLEHKPGRKIAFDGKALRGSKSVYTLNAYAPEEHLFITHTDVDKKENEISAFPDLIECLNLEDSICTGDAMFTQRSIVDLLREKKADYVFALKGNQRSLFELVQNELSAEFRRTQVYKKVDKSRGYVEERIIYISSKINKIDPNNKWQGLKSMIRVFCKRSKGEEFSVENRYFISSLEASPEDFAAIIRGHWGIENGLHRTLDIHFKEDSSQVRDKFGAINLSLFRKFAGNILRRLDPKRTLKSKMRRMLADETFRDRFIQSDF